MTSPKTVLAVGCFDPFHWGHLKHLQAARRMGDILVVGVTRDAFVNKGPDRPVFTVYQRADVIRAFAIVDQVIFVNGSLDALQNVKPDVFALGREYDGKVAQADLQYCMAHGIEIAFTEGPTFSSTDLLHHYDRVRQG